MRRRFLFLIALLVVAGLLTRNRWSRAPFPAPVRLALLAQPNGRPAHMMPVDLGGDVRPALLESAQYNVAMPRRALLTFGMGVSWMGDGEAPGWYRLAVRVDGRPLGEEHTLNPRALRGWRDVSVEVPSPRVQSRIEFDLRFTDRSGAPVERPPGLQLAIADPTLHDLDAYGRSKVVLLVSIDTLRRDHVGAYGYARPTTPTLDALAAEGLVLDDAVSTSSWTLPAHLSMLTSVDPRRHGGVDMRHGFNHRFPTLPAILREAGFATYGVSSHLYVSKTYGLDDGFANLDFRQDRKATDVADRGIDVIDRFGDRPLFLFLHLYDPHWHYDPPARDLAVFEQKYEGTLTGNWQDFASRDPATLTPADLAHLQALYDGEIHYADAEVGRVLKHLAARGLAGSTLVVLTSDHGEEFLEHGSWEHQKTLYEEVIRIPLIVRAPGVAPRREPAQASLLDIAPTILGWAGIPATNMEGHNLLGRSDDREAYGETEQTADGTRKLFLRAGQGRWKAILSVPHEGVPAPRAAAPGATGSPSPSGSPPPGVIREEWYDLATDPGEHRSAPPPASIAESVRTRALERSRQDGTQPAGPSVCLDPEQRERLRALGYVDGGGGGAQCAPATPPQEKQ
jgi:arylsulfatase A-like enzyme